MASPAQVNWIERVLGIDARGNGLPREKASLSVATSRIAAQVERTAARLPEMAAALTATLRTLQDQVAQGDDRAADATLAELATTIDAATEAADAKDKARPPSPHEQAMTHWRVARETVAAPLREVLELVKRESHPGAGEAALRLRSVLRNISRDPESARDAADLEQWLASDDIIARVEQPNGYDITISVREPLLQALRGLIGLLTE